MLHAKSFHPKRLKENIPLGQFQRVRRICYQENDFKTRSEDIVARFQARGYKNASIQTAYTKARSRDRPTLLQKRSGPTLKNYRVVFATAYSTGRKNQTDS